MTFGDCWYSNHGRCDRNPLGEEIVDELDEHEDMRELAREQAGVAEEE